MLIFMVTHKLKPFKVSIDIEESGMNDVHSAKLSSSRPMWSWMTKTTTAHAHRWTLVVVVRLQLEIFDKHRLCCLATSMEQNWLTISLLY